MPSRKTHHPEITRLAAPSFVSRVAILDRDLELTGLAVRSRKRVEHGSDGTRTRLSPRSAYEGGRVAFHDDRCEYCRDGRCQATPPAMRRKRHHQSRATTE